MTDLIKQLEAKRDDLRTINILLSKLIGGAIDHIRKLEAQIETLSIESATSRLAENRERERAEKAEAERDEVIVRAAKQEDRAEKAVAERDAARATRIAVIEREIEATRAATKERCAQVAETKLRWQGSAELNCPFTKQDIAAAIRDLEPLGGAQSEKPVNPYLLGGSSTQSEG